MYQYPRQNIPGVGSTMNRKRVIVLTTLGMLAMLAFTSAFVFHALAPWPVLLWFALCHLFFCVVIARVKPFRGPYTEPMKEPELPEIRRGF